MPTGWAGGSSYEARGRTRTPWTRPTKAGGLTCQLHTHTRARARSSTFTVILKRSYSPYSSVHTCGPAHTRASTNAHTLAHTHGTPHFSQTHSHTPIHTPSQHIHPHTVSLILTFIHPHNPIFTATLMLTTPIQAPKYLHSSLLHLTRYSHSSPLHTLADTYMHITHTLQHALILILTHAHHHTLSHTLPPRLRTHGVTRFSSPALTLAHAHLLR